MALVSPFTLLLIFVIQFFVNADIGLEYEYAGIRIFSNDAAKTVLCTVDVGGSPFQFTIDEVKGNKFLEVISPPMKYKDAQTGACIIEEQVNNWIQKIENDVKIKANQLKEEFQKKELLKTVDRSGVKFALKFLADKTTVEENQCYVTEITCTRDRPKATQKRSQHELSQTYTWKIGIDKSDFLKWFSPGKQCTLSLSVEEAIQHVLDYRLTWKQKQEIEDYAVSSNLGKIVLGYLAVVSELSVSVKISDNVAYKNGADTLLKTDVCHLIKLMKQNKDVVKSKETDFNQESDLKAIGKYLEFLLKKVQGAEYLKEETKSNNIEQINDFIMNFKAERCLNLKMQRDITKFEFPLNNEYVVLYELRSGCSFVGYQNIFSGIGLTRIQPSKSFEKKCVAKKRKFYKKF